MLKLRKIFSILVLFCLSNAIYAEENKDLFKEIKETKKKLKGHSVSIETEEMKIFSEQKNEEITLYNTGVTFFYNYSERNSLTASLKTGITSDSIHYGNQTDNVKLNYLFDISNRYKININNKIDFEIKTGINYFQFSANNKDCKELAPTIGFGLIYKVNSNLDFGVNYNKYFQDSEYDISGFNIGLRYKF